MSSRCFGTQNHNLLAESPWIFVRCQFVLLQFGLVFCLWHSSRVVLWLSLLVAMLRLRKRHPAQRISILRSLLISAFPICAVALLTGGRQGSHETWETISDDTEFQANMPFAVQRGLLNTADVDRAREEHNGPRI